MNREGLKIKICGLSRVEDVEAVNEAGADFAGFMFYPKSRRFVSREHASELKRSLSSYIKSVGVFVNEEAEKIIETAESGLIDLVQLHGDEDESYIERIKNETGLKVIKAFRINSPQDVKNAESSHADYILLDNGAGGTGESFDWSSLKGIKRDYFLAGGLYPENVAEAVRSLSPWGIDVSSGVETDGKKDREKILSFCRNAGRGVVL